MDNLSVHKIAGVREQRGAQLLYLPPCSPDFNPIAFAKLKALVRKAAA
jgi:transposase